MYFFLMNAALNCNAKKILFPKNIPLDHFITAMRERALLLNNYYIIVKCPISSFINTELSFSLYKQA